MSVHLLHADIDGVCACVLDTLSVHYVRVYETQCPSICYTLILTVYMREFETQCPFICYTLVLCVCVCVRVFETQWVRSSFDKSKG